MLTDTQRAFLDGRHYAVLATLNADGTIQQTVVWYILDRDQIAISVGAESVKARNLRQRPALTLTIEDGPRYLTVVGEAAVGPPDPALRRRLAERYVPAEQLDAWLARRPDAPRAFIRLTILRAYGQGV